jgi:hypothetical protein
VEGHDNGDDLPGEDGGRHGDNRRALLGRREAFRIRTGQQYALLAFSDRPARE